MNKLYFVFIFLALLGQSVICFTAYALDQGAAISLNNYDVNRPIFYGAIGTLADGPDFYVEILGGPDANSLRLIASTMSGYPTIFNLGAGKKTKVIQAFSMVDWGLSQAFFPMPWAPFRFLPGMGRPLMTWRWNGWHRVFSCK